MAKGLSGSVLRPGAGMGSQGRLVAHSKAAIVNDSPWTPAWRTVLRQQLPSEILASKHNLGMDGRPDVGKESSCHYENL